MREMKILNDLAINSFFLAKSPSKKIKRFALPSSKIQSKSNISTVSR